MTDTTKPDINHPDYWTSDPDFPVDDWQTDVANNNTRMSYWDWVAAEKENDANEDKRLYTIRITLFGEYLAVNSDEAFDQAMDDLADRGGMEISTHEIIPEYPDEYE